MTQLKLFSYFSQWSCDIRRSGKVFDKRGGIYTKSEEECDILEAFKVLHKEGTGKISVRDFRRCMTTLGDKMSDEEVEEILLFAKTEDGEYIKYAG